MDHTSVVILRHLLEHAIEMIRDGCTPSPKTASYIKHASEDALDEVSKELKLKLD